MAKISGNYFTIWYYYGEYKIGITRLYQWVAWGEDEEAVRAEFLLLHKEAHIKRIND
jgi:hypothetical protein